MAYDYDNATKDTLDEYAKTLGLELDLGKSLNSLVKLVKEAEKSQGGLFGDEGKMPTAKSVSPDAPKWLLHPENKRVFEYTEALADNHLIPCDEHGNRLDQ
jgi:hypothetical protein